MPDQSKYFTGAQKIREINFDIFRECMRLENLLLFFHQ